MYKILMMLLVSTAFFTAANCQSVVYDENAEIRSVPDFSGIEVSGSVSLYLSQGNENAVAISAGEEKYNSKVKTEIKNGILKISVDGGFWNGMGWTNKKLKAYVSIKNPGSIDVSGASLVSISGVLQTDALKIDISGASEVKGSIDVKNLNIDLSGASVARLSGSAANAMIDASGACKMSSYELVADKCKASASGASSVRITVKSDINASASGGANIYYKGSPQTVNISSSSGASIKKQAGE